MLYSLASQYRQCRVRTKPLLEIEHPRALALLFLVVEKTVPCHVVAHRFYHVLSYVPRGGLSHVPATRCTCSRGVLSQAPMIWEGQKRRAVL